MTTGNPWSGHLKRCADGQYRGVLTDGVGLPIHFTAEVQEDPTGGRCFVLDGVRGKKPAPLNDKTPWDDST